MKKQEIANLSDLLKIKFDSYLSKYKFLFLNKNLGKYFICHTYTKDELYVKFEVNFYPEDYPNYFRIILGEGSLDFPESDWNSTALWRVAQVKNPSSQGGYFEVKSINDVLNILEKALDDFEKIGKDFLYGNLDTFIIARKNQNTKREPYKIYSKGKNEQLQTEYDSKIIELKNKYS